MLFFNKRVNWDDVKLETEIISEETLKHTPDARRLSMAKKQWLFLCDEFQLGHADYEQLPITIFMYYGLTHRSFFMYKSNVNPDKMEERQRKIYPILMEGKDYATVPRLRVKGQLHLIEPDTLFFLDKVKRNGILFERKRIGVDVNFRIVYGNGAIRKGKVRIQAWVYVGKDEFWTPKIDNGFNFKKVKRFYFIPNKDQIGNLGTYYCWTKMEYHGF